MENSSAARYGRLTQAFHWATAILVLTAFILGPGGSEQNVYAAAHDFDRQLHETLGLGVFALLLLRLVWRLMDTRPAPLPLARWMEISAKTVKALLYLLLLALPLTAIAGAWLEGHPLTLLAGFEIASPFAVSHAVGEIIAEIHTWLGDAMIWLAGVHALAGLYHHFVLKDGVLLAMLPRWPRRPARRT